jgi:hypothetical protein
MTPKSVLESKAYSPREIIDKSRKNCLRVNHDIKTSIHTSKFICAAHKDINFIVFLLKSNNAIIQIKNQAVKRTT